MKTDIFILSIILFSFPVINSQVIDSIMFQGQASGWMNVNPGNELPLWFGVRYIPQVNYELTNSGKQKIDFEVSANISGNTGIYPFSRLEPEGKIKPYRLWTRYSNNQLEFRLGLQKINFGSASMLRPLMWFDQVDPRDPLQLTDGVWGLLGRYYFLNNANIWLWGLYGNEGPKTWEIGKTSENKPEFGGRVQLPLPAGEAALSFHHREADLREMGPSFQNSANIPENRVGFDVKADLELGVWLEAAWIRKNKYAGDFSNQELITLGSDYTLAVGNGLHISLEHLFFSFGEIAFKFQNRISFSGTSLTYPIGIMDNINAIFYYDHTNKNLYNFINWQRQFNKISFYLMAFWNPDTFQLPQQGEGGQMFAGKGAQIMLVYNH